MILTHILNKLKTGFILTIHVKVIWSTFLLCSSSEKVHLRASQIVNGIHKIVNGTIVNLSALQPHISH